MEETPCAFRRLTTKALVYVLRCCASQEPSAIWLQASLAKRASSGISHESLRAVDATTVAASGVEHGFGSATMQAIPPCETFVSPGLRVHASTTTSLVRCWCGAPFPGAGSGAEVVAIGTRGKPFDGPPASANRRVVALFSAWAARRASLAPGVASRAWKVEITASSQALVAAFEALAVVSEALAVVLAAAAEARAAAVATCLAAVSASDRCLTDFFEAAPKASAAVKARLTATMSALSSTEHAAVIPST